MAQHASIVFLQGDEAEEILDRLERRDGDSVVYWGPTDETVRDALEYLQQWDYGTESEHDVREESSRGAYDKHETVGDYVMSWDLGLSYIGLERIIH